jgi:xanthine dehydrogenase accessory factor
MATQSDLRETFEQLDELRRHERRVAMATLVSTKGTTPRREGAKMWVGEGGRILGSVTIGGCVDARVLEEAENVLRAGTSRLLTMSLGDADAWEIGLTCGGTVELLVEAVALDDMRHPITAAYDAVRAEALAGRRSVLVAPLRESDSRRGGEVARLVVREDGGSSGTLGDAALDRAAADRARDVIRRASSRTEIIEASGAGERLFFELHGPATTLLIFGAGQVAIPLVRLAKVMGWNTVVIDGRERFATRERFPDADEIRIGILADIAAELSYDASTFVILVAHDYKFELPVLRVVLEREPAYIGLLGNRSRGAAVLRFLTDEGMSPERIARVHVPIGLDIGARTPSEIALSVIAEALAVRNGRPGTPMKERDAGSGR